MKNRWQSNPPATTSVAHGAGDLLRDDVGGVAGQLAPPAVAPTTPPGPSCGWTERGTKQVYEPALTAAVNEPSAPQAGDRG